MDFKYRLTKKDYKKIIYQYHSRFDIIWVVIASIVFLLTMQQELLDNVLLMFITYIIYVAIIYLFLVLINKLCTNILIKYNEKKIGIEYGTYECKLTKNKFIEKLNDKEREIELKNIKKIKKYKGMFIVISAEEPLAFIFKQKLFENPADYQKVFEQFNKKVKNDRIKSEIK